MTGDGPADPAASPAPSTQVEAAPRPPSGPAPGACAAVLDEIGPADPAVEPAVDLRRRLIRAAGM